MNPDFALTYARQTAEHLLHRSLIDQSLASPQPHPADWLAQKNFKAFSVYEHVLFVVSGLCRAFNEPRVFLSIGRTLADSLTSKSPLFVHFGQFYCKVSLIVSI